METALLGDFDDLDARFASPAPSLTDIIERYVLRHRDEFFEIR